MPKVLDRLFCEGSFFNAWSFRELPEITESLNFYFLSEPNL